VATFIKSGPKKLTNRGEQGGGLAYYAKKAREKRNLCYFDGKPTQGRTVKISESSKDKYGTRVPVCDNCFGKHKV